MATFPKLKTGAVAQYPLSRKVQFRSQTVRFVDGTEQRFRDCAVMRQRWEIRWSDLDESELAALEEFFLENQGAYGSFTFVDPLDGHVYEDCSLEGDELDLLTMAEMRGNTQLTVVRNR